MYEWAGEHEHLRIIDDILSVTRKVDATYHVYGSFGDVYLQIAAIREKYSLDKRLNSDSKIGIYLSPKYQDICRNTFQDDPNVHVWLIDNAVLNFIFNKVRLLGNHKNFPIRLLPTLYPLIPELIMSGKLLYSDFLRNLIGSQCAGKIPAIESLVHLEEASKLLHDNNIMIGKTVLICADNNSQAEFPEDIWIEVIKAVHGCGWEVCINDSGNNTHSEAKNLRNFGLNNSIKFIKIPPHLPISMTKLMGSYIGGSNGFTAIQAYFGDSTIGMHLINCLGSQNEFIKTPGGELIEIKNMYHCNSIRDCNLGLQIELPIFATNDLPNVGQEIAAMLLDATAL